MVEGGNLNHFVRAEPQVQNPPIVPIKDEEDPDPDLYADEPTWSSSSEESNPALKHNIETESDFNPFSKESNSRQSGRTSPAECIHRDLVHLHKKLKIQASQMSSAHHLKLQSNIEEDQKAKRT